MAGFLPKEPSQFHKLSGAKIAIIASMWHHECVNEMVNRAVDVLIRIEVLKSDIFIHKIPGSLELPLAAKLIFENNPQIDAILAFGVVLKGATTHDSSVIQAVVDGFNRISLDFGKPIINEVIGVSSIDDAKKRSAEGSSNKGLEAVFAVSEFLSWSKLIKEQIN